jgi:predicted permease
MIAAGLLTRSLQNLRNFYPGFNKENVLLLSIHPMTVGYKDAEAVLLYRDLLDRMNRIPGVRSATFSFFSPLRGPVAGLRPKIEEITRQSGREAKPVALSEVGPDYFKTLETPVLSGRDFIAADQAGAPKVSIINEAMAHEYFGDENPIGRHLNLNGDGSWLGIVGVVRETKNRGIRESPMPMIYVPLYQSPEGAATFEVRTAIDPLSASDAIQRVIRATDSRIPIYDIKTLSEQVDDSLVQERLVASLSGLFGLLGLTLAAVGLYGLMTYATNRRTGEIGIRMALGATRAQITGMVLRETSLLVLLGLAIGIPAATASSYLIGSELYGLRVGDPLTVLIASLIMAGIAVFAGYLPAKRASHVDPMVALRTQ